MKALTYFGISSIIKYDYVKDPSLHQLMTDLGNYSLGFFTVA